MYYWLDNQLFLQNLHVKTYFSKNPNFMILFHFEFYVITYYFIVQFVGTHRLSEGSAQRHTLHTSKRDPEYLAFVLEAFSEFIQHTIIQPNVVRSCCNGLQ